MFKLLAALTQLHQQPAADMPGTHIGRTIIQCSLQAAQALAEVGTGAVSSDGHRLCRSRNTGSHQQGIGQQLPPLFQQFQQFGSGLFSMAHSNFVSAMASFFA